jgi:hypothetical protein
MKLLRKPNFYRPVVIDEDLTDTNKASEMGTFMNSLKMTVHPSE